MAHWICEFCGKGFKRPGNGKRRPIRFCSQACYHAWRKANITTVAHFAKGHVPWSKGMKGRHFSPATEFKKGNIPVNHCEVGTVRIRHRKRSGKKRAWIKIAEPNVWRLRCKAVWEKAHGPIPRGLLIHHLNEDTLDDGLDNLSAISRAAHLKIHRPEFEEKRLQKLIAAKQRAKLSNGSSTPGP